MSERAAAVFVGARQGSPPKDLLDAEALTLLENQRTAAIEASAAKARKREEEAAAKATANQEARAKLEKTYRTKGAWMCIRDGCGNCNVGGSFTCAKCSLDALVFYTCQAKTKSGKCGQSQPAIIKCCLKCGHPMKAPPRSV